MTGPKTLILLLLCAAALFFNCGCIYKHPPTGNTYFFSTEYNDFTVEESLAISPSNYVGFCFLPMKESDDRGVSDLIQGMTSKYLTDHGYVLVTQEDLKEDTSLIDYTFLVGFEYKESLLYERYDLSIYLYNADRKDDYQNHLFWSFSCQRDAFPISRANLEPVYQDLFTQEPANWGEYATIFPKRSVPNSIFNEFNERLNSARNRRLGLKTGN
ncbi:hypothetical protein IKW72_06735 [bacterium]|nr:hypothetical protein [bacterium]